MRKFKQKYLDAPNEKGWWWFTDGQSITPMFVDPDNGIIREMVGSSEINMPINKLKGHWQKAITPGNATITIIPPD